MQPGRRNLCALVLFAVAAAFLLVAPAAAHAVLMESNPPLKGAVSGPNVPIMLRFNVRIDTLRSRLTLMHPDGSAQALEINKQTPADTLSAAAPRFAPGAFRPPSPTLPSDAPT